MTSKVPNSAPRFPYWGISPEGGTRIRLMNEPDSLADVRDTATEVDHAVELLKEFARKQEKCEEDTQHQAQ